MVMQGIALKIWQLYYKGEHLDKLFPICEHIYNPKPDKYLENSMMVSLVDEIKQQDFEGYCGVLSWKFKEKINKEVTQQTFECNSDVITFQKDMGVKRHDPIQFANNYHGKGFEEVFKKITPTDWLYPKKIKTIVYFNYFLCKEYVLIDYVDNVLAPAIDKLENDKSIQSIINQPQPYKKGRLPENLQAEWGINYYPMHVFLLERLFMYFLENRNYSVTSL
jgi:hypothetical protein